MKWKYLAPREHKFNYSVVDDVIFRGIRYCGWIKAWVDYDSIYLNPIDSQFKINLTLVSYQLDLVDEPYTELDTKTLTDQENYDLDRLCSDKLLDELINNFKRLMEGE